ncbi:hypothetical protein BC567DRAFT_211092 [Phyllosticta citribraziliensis]
MNPHNNQYRDGHWRGTQPPLGADAQRPSTSGSRPPPPPLPLAANGQQVQVPRPWHRFPPPLPLARPAGPPAGQSFPAFGVPGLRPWAPWWELRFSPWLLCRRPGPPASPTADGVCCSPAGAIPVPPGNPRRSEEHDRRGLREVHIPALPAVGNNGSYYHQPVPADRLHGGAQAVSTTGGQGAGRDQGRAGGSGRGGRDFGGDRGQPPVPRGRKRGYEEMAAEPQQQQQQQHTPRGPRQQLTPYAPRRDRAVVVPPFSGVLENRAKFSLSRRKREEIQPGRILFLKHQSSIHQFTCLIYQMGDNGKPGGFTRYDYDKVNRFFNHPIIVVEAPTDKGLVKVVTLTSLGGLTPEQKYAADNFNSQKHGSHRAELFRSDYLELHHPGVSDAAPYPGCQRQLHLRNDKKLMDRSYVNLDGGKTYMVEGQYLVPYQDFGEKNPDYRLEDDSLEFLIEHRAKLEAEREERDRAKWPTGKAPNERW